MSRYASRSRLKPFIAPDVTPLVDLTFLLLIVFMITAPALEHSLNVSPPELSAEPIIPKEHIVINIDGDGVVYFKEEVVARDRLRQILAEKYAANGMLQVFLRGDEARPYGEIIGVMKLIRDTGITDVSLVTQAEIERK